MVTGKYDGRSTRESEELYEMARRHGSIGGTQCDHILSESTDSNISGTETEGQANTQREFASSAWALLDRFGYKDLLQNFNGADIHRLENVMTLSSDVHDYFDRLEFCFEETVCHLYTNILHF